MTSCRPIRGAACGGACSTTTFGSGASGGASGVQDAVIASLKLPLLLGEETHEEVKRRSGTKRLQDVRCQAQEVASTFGSKKRQHLSERFGTIWRRWWWMMLSGQLWWSRSYERFSMGLIVVNVVADILDSIENFPFTEDSSPSFRLLECFTCSAFTCEYCIRLWACVEAEEYSDGLLRGRLRFATEALPVVDLIVLIVFYADIIMTYNCWRGLESLRAVRSLRLLAMLKMERRMMSCSMVINVLAKKQHELLAILSLVFVLLVMSSTMMYFVENPAQPENFASIPATMWWSVTAMTTVGYGDVVPLTPTGKTLASAISFIGIGLFALPSGLVSQGFVELLEERRQVENDELADMIIEEADESEELRNDIAAVQKTLAALRAQLRGQEQALEGLREKWTSVEEQALEGLRVKWTTVEGSGFTLPLPAIIPEPLQQQPAPTYATATAVLPW